MSDRLHAGRSRGSFSAVLTGGEFRWLWFADVQSLLGDQLARIALTVLVFERTGSGLASAATYAATFVPAVVGGVVLGPLADRLPRRRLLVVGDLARAALVTPMAAPGVPLWGVVALVVLVVLIGGPWKAAESALVADIVADEHYVLGVGLRTATLQAAQLVGFAAGGAVVALVGIRPALVVNAGTFVVSAAILSRALRSRAAAQPRGSGSTRDAWWHGARHVLSEPPLRVLLAYSWLIGVLIVPEGLAAPYAAGLDLGVGAVGLLLAAGPAGVLLGSVIVSRFVPGALRAAALAPLAFAAGVPLVACFARPGLGWTLALWALSGLCLAYQVQVVAEFVAIVPDRMRGQGIALASSGLLAAQGIGLLAGGGLAQLTSPSTAIGCAGVAACVVAAVLARLRGHARAVEGAGSDPSGAAGR